MPVSGHPELEVLVGADLGQRTQLEPVVFGRQFKLQVFGGMRPETPLTFSFLGAASTGPGLAELIDHARPGDRLCIIRLDRLGRSLRELLETVDGLKARGIHHPPDQPRGAPRHLVFHVFGSIAHFERRLISERTRDGIAAARKRGRTPGRPPLDPETVSAAEKLIAAGLSPARAAKQLGIGLYPDKAHDKRTILDFRRNVLRELKKIKLAWPELKRPLDPLVITLV